MIIMNKIKIFIIVLFLSSCGYTSIYKDLSDTKLNIKINNIKGDKDINNSLKRELERYSRDKDQETFFIDIESIYNKIIVSKDATGKASDYKLQAEVKFIINYKESTTNISYKEVINFAKISDVFEEKQYELTIKNNFASSITDKLIERLMSLR